MSRPDARIPPGLAQFLAEEVRARVYADMLLEWVDAAGRGQPVEGGCGDAYCVSFENGTVLIEHEYLSDRPPVRVPLELFRAALLRHRETPGALVR